jgi:hypothetical protein
MHLQPFNQSDTNPPHSETNVVIPSSSTAVLLRLRLSKLGQFCESATNERDVSAGKKQLIHKCSKIERKWNEVERKWNEEGTKKERKWNENGTKMERKWDEKGTKRERKRTKRRRNEKEGNEKEEE